MKWDYNLEIHDVEDTQGQAGSDGSQAADDRFFRNMVTNMRNGVLAIDREGRVVMINEEACRILEIAPDAEDTGRHFSDLLRHHHDVVRILAGAFEMSTLPNRAELRLKPTGKVIGYTLSLVRDERLRVHGAALFFKDLTLVEQAEERERLRDRLAALGEMAATIAHEVKNPLASIEVKAGLVRRQVTDREDLRGLMSDIISEAKMANAIVVLMEYVGDVGNPAPPLTAITLEPGEVHPLFDRIVHNIDLLLRHKRIHGDLSAYNILYWDGDIKLIDFPQVVNPESNPAAWNLFQRDVTRICQYFATQGLKRDGHKLAADLWSSRGYKITKEVHPRDLDAESKDDRRLWEKQKKSK